VFATGKRGDTPGHECKGLLDFACFGYSFPTHMFEPVTPIRPYVRAAVAAGGAGEPILDTR
jgi:hypothetical protein